MPSFDALRGFGLSARDAILRRFMSWPKFQSLIETQTLYFSPASEFEDKTEGHYTNQDEREREAFLRKLGFSARELTMAAEVNAAVQKLNQGPTVVSCWTEETPENPRMWTDYGRSGEAVMIETTVGRLIDCLGSDFLIVRVRYVDLERDQIPRGHSLLPFFYKDKKCFGWEKEVRIIGDMDQGALIGTPKKMPIKVGDLLTRVVVSPTAPSPFGETVKSLVERAISGLKVEHLEH
jgi:hypothetical protein